MRDGERKILNALRNTKTPTGLKFSEILEKTGLSRPTVSDYLKSLQKREYVVKDVDARRYKLTSKGRDELKKAEATEMVMENAEIVETSPFIILQPTQQLPAKHMKLEAFAVPFSNENVKPSINVFLALDETNRKYIECVVKELRSSWTINALSSLFHEVGTVLSKKQGLFYDGHSREKYWKEPLYLSKLIKTEKSRVDFDATLMVTFNGKEAAQKIDWSKLLEHAPDYEKKQTREWKNLRRNIEKNKESRKLWLEHILISDFQCSSERTASSSTELEDNFVKRIMKEKWRFPKPPSETDIREGIESLKQDGIIRISPRTEYVFEIDEKKAELKSKNNLSLLQSGS